MKTINKTLKILFLLLISLNSINAQMTTDSLLGTYEGENWLRFKYDTGWTNWEITPGLFYIRQFENDGTCGVHKFSYFYYHNSAWGIYKTTYGFCTETQDNFVAIFFGGDSLIILYDYINVPPDPNHPVEQYEKLCVRFYGKKICDTVPYGLHVENAMENTVSVFPNPVTDYVWVRLSDNAILHSTMEIFDMYGKRMYAGTLTSVEQQIFLPVLSKGIYLLKINTEQGTICKKIIKL
ncbi:MAG: T9SS type A sorting domain-containing protein [Bacteroidales bacterium]|nr:T9SS type A sorting domain-containing protein [Bacteroidales bacterium]